jgi:hypothetical protein
MTYEYCYERALRAGMSPAQAERQAKLDLEIDVFGVGFKRDENGRPIEQGIGSASNPSKSHLAALAKERQRQGLPEPEPK